MRTQWRGGARVRRRVSGRPARRTAARLAHATDRSVAGEVLLFDFGAQVCGYRSDMTRTLFVGEPTAARPATSTELVAAAQEAAFDALAGLPQRASSRCNRAIDAAARDVIAAAGHGEHFGHGLGHGIGLATHEAPSLGRLAPERPLPSPTVFSVEPGVYLDGETGVRIEDLVLFDRGARPLRAADALPARGHRRRRLRRPLRYTPRDRPVSRQPAPSRPRHHHRSPSPDIGAHSGTRGSAPHP